MADPRQERRELEQDLVAIAVDYLNAVKGQLDPYTSKKSYIDSSSLDVTMYTPGHIQFAKYGRGKGKRPPFDEIYEWVRKKNLQFTGLSQQGTASVIVAAIGKRGTIGHKPNAPNALEEALKDNYNEYARKTNDELVVYFTNTMKDVYEKLPIQKEIKL